MNLLAEFVCDWKWQRQ